MRTYTAEIDNDNASFDQWMNEVDRLVEGTLGLSTRDLPDLPYYCWYEDYVTPRRAAARVIHDAFYA